MMARLFSDELAEQAEEEPGRVAAVLPKAVSIPLSVVTSSSSTFNAGFGLPGPPAGQDDGDGDGEEEGEGDASMSKRATGGLQELLTKPGGIQELVTNPSPEHTSDTATATTAAAASALSTMKYLPVSQFYSPVVPPPPPVRPPAASASSSRKSSRKLSFDSPANGNAACTATATLVYKRRRRNSELYQQKQREKDCNEVVSDQPEKRYCTVLAEVYATEDAPISKGEVSRAEDEEKGMKEGTELNVNEKEILRGSEDLDALPHTLSCSVFGEDSSPTRFAGTTHCDSSVVEAIANDHGSTESCVQIAKVYVRRKIRRKETFVDVQAQEAGTQILQSNLGMHEMNTVEFRDQTGTRKGLSSGKESELCIISSDEEENNKTQWKKAQKLFRSNRILARIQANGRTSVFRKRRLRNRHQLKKVANGSAITGLSRLRSGNYRVNFRNTYRVNFRNKSSSQRSQRLHSLPQIDKGKTRFRMINSSSLTKDKGLKMQGLASPQNVPRSDSSVTVRTIKEIQNSTGHNLKPLQMEEVRNAFLPTEMSDSDLRTAEPEMTSSIEGSGLRPIHVQGRKKRKMQRVEELVCPLWKGDVVDSVYNTGHLLRNRHLVTLSQSNSIRASTPNLVPQKAAHQKWRCVNVTAADPTSLVGRKCKVYWPLDEDWYIGVIQKYDPLIRKHHVAYDDGDREDIILADEFVKLYLSHDEMIALNLQPDLVAEGKKLDYDDIAGLAAGVEDLQGNFGHGEIVWAKIKGHPMWPAIVMDEKCANACGLEAPARDGMLPVQFFGSYDYARISLKHVVPFSQGLALKFHSKCKRLAFEQGLEEAERFLRDNTLPDSMAELDEVQKPALSQERHEKESEESEEDEDFMGDERTHKIRKSVESLFTCPIKLGSLQVLSLGKIVKDSEYFHDEHHIWTEGFTAIRKFASTEDPDKLVEYKMEVLRDPSMRSMPLFRVTPDDSDQVDGPTPSICWRKIFQRLDRVRQKYSFTNFQRQHYKSGEFMFGFSDQRILKLIQALPNAMSCSKFTGWLDNLATDKPQDLIPAGYKSVKVQWKHPDRCSVCYLDEEYVNNMFLQCDRCRMLVHMHCYGELEPPDGHLWLCKLCRPGAPAKVPPCCLCPVEGGAMKRTTDGRWAHLTCAMWIPETCLLDIKRMEPIDGLKCINKDRWKLICSICKVSYGVCIQCSEISCCVSYHILCARAEGFVTEVQEDFGDKGKEFGEEHERPIRLLSYCRKHRQPDDERLPAEQNIIGSHLGIDDCSTYCPPDNISGCARCEPYNATERRGRQEPEVCAAATAKRLFVEKRPYVVSGICRSELQNDLTSVFPSLQEKNAQVKKYVNYLDSKAVDGSSETTSAASVDDASSIFSMSERYEHMRSTVRQRLTFGKSAIHGWGIFTKHAHRAGDMVIEYAGEIVRPIVADIRERCFYNSLVGAGTYMFRIDDERVVDATRAGSLAHLINHACEPNCYSRVITVRGEEHIIIFAKQDIYEGEELTYDYRFASKGEKLACYCGFPRCRGSVNASDDDEESTRICVRQCELAEWLPIIVP